VTDDFVIMSEFFLIMIIVNTQSRQILSERSERLGHLKISAGRKRRAWVIPNGKSAKDDAGLPLLVSLP